ncbi:hypothetical protein VB713_25685 [Anabaena cylindrica UHCC 0172]|uniref:hypothetical protein n=1 Tax=Anabaena cylindrica TaxID=1165 RepID=UPI002B2156DE|nr:hypothetical protein [Anabaena cylindrica]MEA5554330.1 hypothetical protein [Anabaena cylindrica UHCC 0172]
MFNHRSTKQNQHPSLNLNQLESILADGLLTKKVRELVKMLVDRKVSTEEIREKAKNGKLEFSYSYGVLRIVPSHKGKSGRCWRWDVIFSPVSLSQVSE